MPSKPASARRTALALSVLTVVALFAVLSGAHRPAPALADALGISHWQMDHPAGQPIVPGVFFSSHGQTSEYNYAPPIPAVNDPGWQLTPSPTIGFGCGGCSILSGYRCLGALDFHYFQSIVHIPANLNVTTFNVSFGNTDDGAKVVLYNSAHPGGVDLGAYVFLGNNSLNVNFAPYVVAGDNRVLITQVDDCAVGNNLGYGAIEVNGSVVKTDQTISFAPLSNKTYGDPDFSVSATASSGLPVSFSVGSGDACTLSGHTVHLTGAGSCTVTAHQGGDSNYNPAPDVSRTFTIAKVAQTISFASLSNKTYGDPDFTVSATGGGSGNPVTFAVGATDQCTLAGANTVHITGAGSCTVTASQAGNTNYSDAASVSRSFSIAKAGQTIVVATSAPSSATFGSSFTIVATGGASGNPLVFGSAGACTNSGASFTMTSGSGSCSITMNQAGTSNFLAAPQVSESTTALPAPTTIAVASVSQDYHDQAALSATVSGITAGGVTTGGSVQFAVGGSSVCGGSGQPACPGIDASGAATLTIPVSYAPGSYNLTASFTPTNPNFAGSASTTKLTVTKEETSLALTSAAVLPSGGVTVSARLMEDVPAGTTPVDAGRTVSFSAGGLTQSATTDASGVARTTLALPPGQFTLSAHFAGDAYYQSSADATETLIVYQPTQFVIWGGGTGGVQQGQDYTFWGAQWAKQVSGNAGAALASFKGYANTVSGATWTARPGGSSTPPASVATYISVLVTTQAGKQGSTISGNVTETVVLKVDNPAAYAPSPDSPGSGVVVAILR